VKRWLVLPVCAALIAGCGGDDDGEPADTTPAVEEVAEPPQEEDAATEEAARPTEDEFIRRADRICRRANDRIRELPPGSDAQFDVVAEGLVDLRALDVPESLERPWRQYLTAVELQTEAEQRGDRGEMRRHQRRKSQVALEMGFAVCGSG
jgi:hypothetical protein